MNVCDWLPFWPTSNSWIWAAPSCKFAARGFVLSFSFVSCAYLKMIANKQDFSHKGDDARFFASSPLSYFPQSNGFI